MSLTCICCKILEHIKVSNISKHLAFESFLVDCQHGFRVKGLAKPTCSFLPRYGKQPRSSLNPGHRQTDVIIMDFAKAFDKVPHRRLLYKLDYYGIRGSTHKWIASWLSERSQKVMLDCQASDLVPVLSDVTQGSVLGCSSFILTIFLKLSGHLFASLLVIVFYTEISNPQWTARFYKMS